ncbi:hypothetical protein A9W98_18060 [Mycobacterium gordonae]|uniref:GIY-YIG domain-containing protein n=1 Tax=Mycobacterium gordonae TaxID=1778 RepID=A0A1A6BHQ8_MYCGO|nr:hypothetical protein A9W98_18060 [Mycobacterium gordonae]
MTKAIRSDIRGNTHVLYRFYSQTGQLLYVGITNDPHQRFAAHGIEKPWWPRVADIKIERLNSREELAAAELEAIRTENPRYNKAHASGTFEEVHVRRVRGRSICSDANRFGTSPPTRHPDEPQTPRRLRLALYCPKCYGSTVTRAADENWKPIADTARCDRCGETWTDREWRRANYGF